MVNYDILKNRVYGLDLMRSLAMLCVIFTHSGYRTIFGMRYGIPAVESFFVVSGFLIGGILIRDFKDEVNITNVTNFWKKRWFRTLPLYYVVLLLKFIVVDHSIGLNIFYYFTFLQSNIYGIQFLPVSWTLVVEEWFYLLMPLFFVIFFRQGIKPKNFYILIILFVLADNVLRYLWVLKTNYAYGAMVGNFVFRMDSNLIGVGLAGLKAFHSDIFKKMADIKYFVFGMLAIVLLFVLFSIDGGGTSDVNDQAIWVRTFWFSLISIFVAVIIPFFYYSPIFAPKEGKQLFRWVITWISLLSYPIYLVHAEMYLYLDESFPVLKQINSELRFLIENSIVLALSLLLYHFVDKPVLNYRSKFLKK